MLSVKRRRSIIPTVPIIRDSPKSPLMTPPTGQIADHKVKRDRIEGQPDTTEHACPIQMLSPVPCAQFCAPTRSWVAGVERSEHGWPRFLNQGDQVKGGRPHPGSRTGATRAANPQIWASNPGVRCAQPQPPGRGCPPAQRAKTAPADDSAGAVFILRDSVEARAQRAGLPIALPPIMPDPPPRGFLRPASFSSCL
jgi:hypothetical protein